MAISTANRRGIMQMLAAMGLFSVNDSLVKLASELYGPGQVMLVRGVFALAFGIALAVMLGQLRHFRRVLTPLVLVRGLLEAVTALTFIAAVAHMPIALITAILQATPLLLALLTAVLGIEPMGWRRWAAVGVGFFGVLVIVRPGLDGIDHYALLALASAFVVALRDIVTRRIGPQVPGSGIMVVSTAAVTIAGAIVVFAAPTASGWVALESVETLYLLVAGLVVTLGNLAIVSAFRGTQLSVVSPFRYSSVLFAVLAGLLIWHEPPDGATIAGVSLVAGAGIYTIHRERRRSVLEPASHAGPPP